MQEIMTFFGNHLILSSIALVIIILLTVLEVTRKSMTQSNITPLQLTQMINHQNAVVIDIRPNDAYRKAHIIDALSLSTKELTETKKLDKYKKRPIVLVDQTGAEARKIAAQLKNQGYTVYTLGNGIQAWINAEMPLVKG